MTQQERVMTPQEHVRFLCNQHTQPSDNVLKLLNLDNRNYKIGISRERLEPIIPILRQYISFWREYPDLFVDFMTWGTLNGPPSEEEQERRRNENNETFFKLYFYQRVFLRAAVRFRKSYFVFPRGYSKSFLSVLAQMIKCILWPGAKLYTAAGGKGQSAAILQEKVEEICHLIPAFNREILRERGNKRASTIQKDYCRYVFKSYSSMDNIVASEKSRGKRRQGGSFEECVSIDRDILQQVLIPVANISRKAKDGTVQPDEMLNQSELYITTAGHRSDYAYEKLIQLLVETVLNPLESFIMGGTWRIPVISGLQSKKIIDDKRNDETYSDIAFQREYEQLYSLNIINCGDILRVA